MTRTDHCTSPRLPRLILERRPRLAVAVMLTASVWLAGCATGGNSSGNEAEPQWIPRNMSMHTDPYDVSYEAREDEMAKSPRAAARNQARREAELAAAQEASGAAASTGTTPVAPAAGAVAAAPAAGAAVSADAQDAYLEGRIRTIYDLNDRVNSADVQTRVAGGIVYLTGTVDDDIERDLAVDLARSVDGVQGVKSTLAIRNPPPVVGAPAVVDDRSMTERMNDANVTAAVREALIGDARTRTAPIEVSTMRGQVTLVGQVADRAASDAAGSIAAGIPGVSGVTNGLVVAGN